MSDPPLEPHAIAGFQSALLSWFDGHKRDLPWRASRDPYAIWISEIMLQQTRVETVIPYYRRFVARFPDVRALAGAPLQDVLAAWSGLGYYRRARSLHAFACEVVTRFGGRVPVGFEELLSLPGVGEYTAGAVASIAADARVPAVDGNAIRVLARWLAIEQPVDDPAARRSLKRAACALVPEQRPGDFNQALMELGALVCVPKTPRCEACPVAAGCAAKARGLERDLPVLRTRTAPIKVALVAAVAAREGEVLLGQRPLGGLFGGLWEPPLVGGSVREAGRIFAASGIELRAARSRPKIVHVLTHRVLEVRVATAEAPHPGPLAGYVELAYFDAARQKELPMSTLARRILATHAAG